MKNSKAILCDALGKGMGEMLYNALRGMDERKLTSDKPRKSVSCDINVRGSHYCLAGGMKADIVRDKVPE